MTAEVPADTQPQPKLAPDLPVASRERIIVFVPGRPLLVDLHLTSDGQPHAEALDKLVAEVLKLADADGDGRTTWKELCDCPRVKYGQYGSLPIDNEKQRKTNHRAVRHRPRRHRRPGRVAAVFDSQRGWFSFVFVRGTLLTIFDLNRRGSPTWRIIDEDEDGIISAAERAAAPHRLAGRDSDDDEIVLASDLNPRLLSPDRDMAMYERRRRGPEAARMLGSHADWVAVLSRSNNITAAAAACGPIAFRWRRSCLPSSTRTATAASSREELAMLNELPADVVIAVEFGRPADREQGTGDGGQGTESGDSESEDEERSRLQNQAQLKLVRVAQLSAGALPMKSSSSRDG